MNSPKARLVIIAAALAALALVVALIFLPGGEKPDGVASPGSVSSPGETAPSGAGGSSESVPLPPPAPPRAVSQAVDRVSPASLVVKLRHGGEETPREVDLRSGEAPGFLPAAIGERIAIEMPWPYGDAKVSVTRMDGGAFAASAGQVMALPVKDGAVEFTYDIGPEAGRYQVEVAGLSGRTEVLAFWAGEQAPFEPEPSGLSFVDPPLRDAASN